MSNRATDRRRDLGRSQAHPALQRRSSSPVLALQRSIGNRAVAAVLARAPVRTGTVHIGGVGDVKVKGGNLDDWAGTATLDFVEVTSAKGKHSAKLEHMSNAGNRSDVKVMIASANEAGEQLNVGGGTQLEIKDARIKRYAIQDGVETWRVADFEIVKRTKITHKIS